MATITSPRPQSPASILRNPSNNSPQIPPSPSLSSSRPSLDLPTSQNGRADSPALGDLPQTTQRPRNRAALRDYYNLKSKAQPSPSRTSSIISESNVTSTTTTTQADTSQLDEPTFSSENYVSSLLQTSSLQSLLRTEATLISEIKQLDGERKALVYNNYSKLIAATQTIGRMQRAMNTDDGMMDVERVRGMVEGIGRMARELGVKKQTDNADAEMRRMERQKRDLVRWVVEAPGRFESMDEAGRKDELLKEWKTVQSMLEKWKGVRGVAEVTEKCKKIIDGLEEHEEGDG